jgi:hypothetical protein
VIPADATPNTFPFVAVTFNPGESVISPPPADNTTSPVFANNDDPSTGIGGLPDVIVAPRPTVIPAPDDAIDNTPELAVTDENPDTDTA